MVIAIVIRQCRYRNALSKKNDANGNAWQRDNADSNQPTTEAATDIRKIGSWFSCRDVGLLFLVRLILNYVCNSKI